MKDAKIKAIMVGVAAVCVLGVVFLATQCSKQSIGNDSNSHNDYHQAEVQLTPAQYENENEFSNETMPTPGSGIYNNNKELSATDSNRGTLTVGVNGSNADGLVLAPKYTSPEIQGKVGYYIETTYLATISTSQTEYCSIEDERFINTSNIYIDWTKDHAKSADYINEQNYGVLWQLPNNDPNITYDYITLSVIDISSYHLLADYTIEISRVDGKFEIMRVYCNDLSVVPEDKYSKAFRGNDVQIIRDNLTETAKKAAESADLIGSGEKINQYDIVCSIVDKPRFKYYMKIDGTPGISARTEGPIVAITFQCLTPTVGHLTLYYQLNAMPYGMDYCWTRTDADILERIEPYGLTTIRK